MKKNKKYNIIILSIILFLIFLFLIFYINFKGRKIYLSEVNVEKSNVLLISKSRQKNCVKGLIDFLNQHNFYVCEKIVFYNNTFDKKNNKKYFYALVVGNDKSLIEIENLSDDGFEYTYLGNELTPNAISDKTGVSYLQIINPTEYKKQEELKKIQEEAKSALPDSIPKNTEIDS